MFHLINFKFLMTIDDVEEIINQNEFINNMCIIFHDYPEDIFV